MSPQAHRRKRIVDIARETFFTEGFSAATMSGIAARLGGSKTTLYAYFPTKETLLDACVDELCARMHTIIDNHADCEHPAEALTAIGGAVLRVLVSEDLTRSAQLVIEEVRRNPDLARGFYQAGAQKGRARMVGLMQSAHERGHIHAPDALEAAEVFSSLLFGDLHLKRLFAVSDAPSDAEIDRRVATAVRVFMAAYAPQKPY